MIKTLLALALVAACAPAMAVTKYVRTDGGTASECNGLADAPYPGTGTNQNCAWNSPTWALGIYQGSSSRLSAGDVLIIKNGSYAVGYGAPSTADKSGCTSSNPQNCYMLQPPNNVTIKGEQAGNGTCKARPEIWGTRGVRQIFWLDGRSGITIECLELTDHSNCLYSHYDSSKACDTSKDYVRHGIYAYDASNIVLRDVNIHGIGQNCLKIGKINTLTIERSRINACGHAGFHGATGCTSSTYCDSFTGTITIRQTEIAWNGCTEDYPTLKIHGCFGSTGGGYGDGLGTYHTAGNWIIEDSYVHHNTSDGLDLRYTTDDTAEVTIRRSWFYSNAGNPVKVWGKLTMENSVVISYCNYFSTRFDTVSDGVTDPTPCRADGNAVFIMVPNMTGTGVIVRHNTITGHGSQLIQLANEDSPTSSSVVRIENNVLVGDDSFANPGSLTKLLGNTTSATVEWYNNHVYNVSNSSCPSGSTCTSPLLRNQNTETFDPRPAADSPVLGAGTTSCGATACVRPTTDIHGRTRPDPAARGAMEYSP